MTRIIATDTETHRGLAILITKPWSFCEPKHWDDCIEFLEHDKEMACWNADYDCQALMKHLPRAVRDRIALLGFAQYGEYLVKYIPHKFMKVWKETATGKQRALFTIYDMRQFYNCALAKAAKKLGVQQKGEIPKSWYPLMRSKLNDPKTRDRVLNYALGDAQTLQQIIDRTVESFAAAGLKFDKPYSNASFAERYFRKKFRYKRHLKAEQFARAAYHGGRIECLKCGFFPEAFYYDIHSAYPSAIANLIKPDGEWFYETDPQDIRPDCVYAFLDCTVDIPKSSPVGPIPVRRRSGAILYPVGRFRKTITLTEYKYLVGRGWPVRIQRAWFHIWTGGDRPFSEINELYTKRKRDPKADYALKIVMNSVYGKMAQVIESRVRTNRVDMKSEIFDDRVWFKRERWKDHTSFVYAAEITARIRIKLLEDIPTDMVISYSTDGVFTTAPLKGLREGDGLGEWATCKRVENLIVVGSGVYTYYDPDPDEQKQVVRFRGFSPAIDLGGMLKQAGRRHFIGLKVMRNTSMRQSAKGGHAKNKMNVLEQVTRAMDVNFDNKRNWPERWNARALTERQFESKPWIYYKPLTLKG